MLENTEDLDRYYGQIFSDRDDDGGSASTRFRLPASAAQCDVKGIRLDRCFFPVDDAGRKAENCARCGARRRR